MVQFHNIRLELGKRSRDALLVSHVQLVRISAENVPGLAISWFAAGDRGNRAPIATDTAAAPLFPSCVRRETFFVLCYLTISLDGSWMVYGC